MLLGKKAKELQTDVQVNEDSISGTLNYVTGYTGFNSSNPLEQEGNFLALKFEAKPGTKITVELIGGTKGPVALDDDMNIVLLIKDNETQKVKVTAIKDEAVEERIYDLTELILASDDLE